jgi:hypothetical protein
MSSQQTDVQNPFTGNSPRAYASEVCNLAQSDLTSICPAANEEDLFGTGCWMASSADNPFYLGPLKRDFVFSLPETIDDVVHLASSASYRCAFDVSLLLLQSCSFVVFSHEQCMSTLLPMCPSSRVCAMSETDACTWHSSASPPMLKWLPCP